MADVINVTSDLSWDMLGALGLNRVVDPMVLRCGEQFLKRRCGAPDADKTWRLLDANIPSLQQFFDTLIFAKKIPVFNYGDTFDMGMCDLDQTLFTMVNHAMEQTVLADVHVAYMPYMECKAAALAELRQLFVDGPRIEHGLAEDVLNELAYADYEWSPSLGELEHVVSGDEAKLARFFLGGLIFQAYAKKIGGEHVMQAKRSRLFAAATLREKKAGSGLEEQLFGELRKRSGGSADEWPWRPSFLPYLLADAATPRDMIVQAKELRGCGMVRDYRDLLQEAMDDWEKNGRISFKYRKDVQASVDAIDRFLGGKAKLPDVKVKLIFFAIPQLELGVTEQVRALWGWMMTHLPGKRHRRLFTRLTIRHAEYVDITRRVRTVWSADAC